MIHKNYYTYKLEMKSLALENQIKVLIYNNFYNFNLSLIELY